MRRHKVKITVAVLAILLLLFWESSWIAAAIRSARSTSYHLDFLNLIHKPKIADPSEIDLQMGSSIPTTYPEPYIHNPIAKHNSTLILLHGTSQDGPGFGKEFLSFPIDEGRTLIDLFPGARFVFPTGKQRWCTVLGRESHAWFDFASFSDRTLNESSQIPGLSESSKFLGQLVENEVEDLLRAGEGGETGAELSEEMERSNRQHARRRIVVGGFSQGSAMACIALLAGFLGEHEGVQIGGFVGLSGWCPFRKQVLGAIAKGEDELKSEYPGKESTRKQRFMSARHYLRQLLSMPTEETNIGVRKMLVFLGHGDSDMKMRVEWGREMGDLLEEVGMEVEWRDYEGLEHWWSEEEMRDLVGFLTGVWGMDEK
jgi:predicted esterase